MDMSTLSTKIDAGDKKHKNATSRLLISNIQSLQSQRQSAVTRRQLLENNSNNVKCSKTEHKENINETTEIVSTPGQKLAVGISNNLANKKLKNHKSRKKKGKTKKSKENLFIRSLL